jgi:hypothetical protein
LQGKWLYLLPIVVLMELGVFCLFVFAVSLVASPAPLHPPDLIAINKENESKQLITNN